MYIQQNVLRWAASAKVLFPPQILTAVIPYFSMSLGKLIHRRAYVDLDATLLI